MSAQGRPPGFEAASGVLGQKLADFWGEKATSGESRQISRSDDLNPVGLLSSQKGHERGYAVRHNLSVFMDFGQHNCAVHAGQQDERGGSR